MKAISLFTGAGGLDLGCEAAGFETVAAVENEAFSQETLCANRARFFPTLTSDRVFGDIVELDPCALLDAAAAAPGDIDLLHGGPPCTPFSKSGYWLAYKRAGEDPKALVPHVWAAISPATLRGAGGLDRERLELADEVV